MRTFGGYTARRQMAAQGRVMAKLRRAPVTAGELTVPERYALIMLEKDGSIEYRNGRWYAK